MVVSLQHHYPQTAPAGSGMCSAAPRLTRTQLITPLSQHISSSNCACWKTSLALHFALQKKQTCWLQKYVTPSHRKGKSMKKTEQLNYKFIERFHLLLTVLIKNIIYFLKGLRRETHKQSRCYLIAVNYG